MATVGTGVGVGGATAGIGSDRRRGSGSRRAAQQTQWERHTVQDESWSARAALATGIGCRAQGGAPVGIAGDLPP